MGFCSALSRLRHPLRFVGAACPVLLDLGVSACSKARRLSILAALLTFSIPTTGCFLTSGAVGIKPEGINKLNLPLLLGDMVVTGAVTYAAIYDQDRDNDAGAIAVLVGVLLGPIVGVTDKMTAAYVYDWTVRDDESALQEVPSSLHDLLTLGPETSAMTAFEAFILHPQGTSLASEESSEETSLADREPPERLILCDDPWTLSKKVEPRVRTLLD